MRYDGDKFKLFLSINEIKDIIPHDQLPDPYVKIRLIPINGSTAKVERKTAVSIGTTNPTFDNEFEFDIHYSDLKNYKLQFIIKDNIKYGLLQKAPRLAFTEVDLDKFDYKTPLNNQWLQLHTGS